MKEKIKKILKEEVTKIVMTEGYVSNFISKTKDIAVKEMNRSGIPASITMAQAVLESGWGKSDLASKYNNYFGIKCHGFKECVELKDANGDMAKWRSYDNVYDSFKDHTDFLVKNGRYDNLFKLGSDNYIGWAYGLQKAGYAGLGNSSYAKLLIDVIKSNGFEKLDYVKKETKPPSKLGRVVYPIKKNGYVNVRYENYVDEGIIDNLLTVIYYPNQVGEVKEIRKGKEDDYNWYKVKLSKPVYDDKYGWVREDAVEFED
jgi:hypothetical protein